MTRSEFLTQLREDFITRHLTPPDWMARLPVWLREYALLLYWTLFKPSALRLHVARLAPKAVNEQGTVGLRGLRVPAVRWLVGRALLLTVGLPLLTILLITGLLLSALGVPFDWQASLRGVAEGVGWGVVLGVVLGVGIGVGWGIVWGVVWGVSGGVVFGVVWGAAGIVVWIVVWGVVWGVSGGVVWGVGWGVVWSVVWDMVWDVILAIVLGVAGILVLGEILNMILGVAMVVILGVAGVVVLGIVLGVVLGVARGVGMGVGWGVIWGVGVGVGWGVIWGVVLGVVLGVPVILGASRLPFWLAELLPARRKVLAATPIAWDELPCLPQPGLATRLADALARDPADGAWWLAYTARHPYARWALSRALASLLAVHPVPFLQVLDALLRRPLPYVEPRSVSDATMRRREADPYFSTKLALAELGGTRAISDRSDALARLVTTPLRRPLPESIVHLARASYHLLEAAVPTDPRRFDPEAISPLLARFATALEPFQDSPPGAEFYHTSRMLERFLAVASLQKVADAPQALGWLAEVDAPLRPAALDALRRLGQAGQAVAAYFAASSELARRDRLAETQAALDAVRVLSETSEVPQPEATLLGLAVERWYRLVAAERDALVAARPFVPLDDFYVAGPPLTREAGRLFVGREAIFRRLEELWRNPFQKVSVVLHGQRRMGKTSILCHLEQGLGPQYVAVLADLQGLLSDPLRPIRSDADLWQALIQKVVDRLHVLGIHLPLHPDEPFEAFLDRLRPHLRDRYLVLMLDEFEKLEQKMDAGAVTDAFLEHLRYLIQHRRELLVLLAGHHTLRERMKRYWEPLMGIARPVRVSYLDEASARRLITDPWEGFRLNYTAEGIARLIAATGRQPMLLQLACSAVIRAVNDRMAHDGYQDYPTATSEQVEQALTRLLEAGETYYFDAVWDWLTEPQRAALMCLADAYRAGSEGWMARGAVLEVEEVVLASLVDREVLEQEGDRYRFRVELLRRWVTHRFRVPIRSLVTS